MCKCILSCILNVYEFFLSYPYIYISSFSLSKMQTFFWKFVVTDIHFLFFSGLIFLFCYMIVSKVLFIVASTRRCWNPLKIGFFYPRFPHEPPSITVSKKTIKKTQCHMNLCRTFYIWLMLLILWKIPVAHVAPFSEKSVRMKMFT